MGQTDDHTRSRRSPELPPLPPPIQPCSGFLGNCGMYKCTFSFTYRLKATRVSPRFDLHLTFDAVPLKLLNWSIRKPADQDRWSAGCLIA
ncbi:jg6346 [Pararge aegeria aegeria]|uniref:Jg6346 protein n=1 Tax=Pararge aegeria aegeria TaxID=348720 RepID=A0A8S4RP89_9NEOP|nr:jg6346 [Pararge aegeria aegeria]